MEGLSYAESRLERIEFAVEAQLFSLDLRKADRIEIMELKGLTEDVVEETYHEGPEVFRTLPGGKAALQTRATSLKLAQIDLPAANTTIVVVDMQNDFVKAEGNLVVPDAKTTIPAFGRSSIWSSSERWPTSAFCTRPHRRACAGSTSSCLPTASPL